MEPQTQERQPGREYKMNPEPEFEPFYEGVGKFRDQVILISGGDSGIGKAVSLAFANEGGNVAIIYKEEDKDALETKKLIEEYGGKCLLIRGDIGEKDFCKEAVQRTIDEFGRLDILVNNAAEQHVEEEFEKIKEEQLLQTFKTNIYSYFFLTQEALPYIEKNKGCILNNASVTAYKGNPLLMDYSSTKGAIVSLTRALSQSLAKKGIRVNAVAPGPIWTPLIPASFDEEQVEKFGKDTPLGRVGQPNEVAGCFTFLASREASYMTGQVLHPNGGTIVNS